MPLFRVAAGHPSESHKDHEPAQVGGVFDDHADALEFIDLSGVDVEEIHRSNVSLPPSTRVRKRDKDTLAELVDLGYSICVQELVATAYSTDDAGAKVASEHRWENSKTPVEPDPLGDPA